MSASKGKTDSPQQKLSRGIFIALSLENRSGGDLRTTFLVLFGKAILGLKDSVEMVMEMWKW